MTKVKDVFTVKLPFPDISSNLATKAHMYLCIQAGENKKILSCQTKKPLLLRNDRPPYRYVDCKADIKKNPFKRDTIIACDYCFELKGIHVDSSLLTSSRRDVCSEMYYEVMQKISFSNFGSKVLEEGVLLALNPLLSKIN
ncbi:hypothetical protein J9537_01100 [Enterococcus raffinosus]|uniref:hypothetical protein n=1 Tax=Enterococcus raffinosus TaxID=71452 RepID=UPI001C458FB1|nr:hypothetical protein [Enterococcus raffinosus]QXJ59416.1 hypothetical protein J9537_01100 [Enterococcus raffinosus]